MPGAWTPEPFEADDGTVPFKRFIEELTDFKFVALDAAIERVLSVRGIDLVRTEWLKALGKGLHEFRVRHDGDEIARMFGGETAATAGLHETVLLRVFVHFYGDKVILLLGGYDKGIDPKERRQQREIAEARPLLAQFKERRRRERHAQGRKVRRRRR
jgi:putative component of toxin-antitoxin plasmid stabilization module